MYTIAKRNFSTTMIGPIKILGEIIKYREQFLIKKAPDKLGA